jgi:hypothetical protein
LEVVGAYGFYLAASLATLSSMLLTFIAINDLATGKEKSGSLGLAEVLLILSLLGAALAAAIGRLLPPERPTRGDHVPKGVQRQRRRRVMIGALPRNVSTSNVQRGANLNAPTWARLRDVRRPDQTTR